ncbi:hypothetical protein EXS74_04025 [Candidatus Woesearchaeota archaeon]|nr:hypothetical protein [Candidatus Woesearchaeota archaeon]
MKFEDLKVLEEKSIERGIPILGPKKGKWLYDKVIELLPQRILELGTANGYSGSILGSQGAVLLTIEMDGRIAQEAVKTFSQNKVQAKVVIGDAVVEIEKLVRDSKNHQTFDLIFIDFAKKQYLAVLENCISLLKVGGYIVADNILFVGCADYKKKIGEHSQLHTEFVLFGVDGLGVSQKIRSR